METAEISYRVADFLKKHAPFHAVEDPDLLAVAAHGRVRFFEPNEYILWQGEPHKAFVFVIQQGTVSLWDEAGPVAELRDVRGAGDLLGLERYTGARSCLHSARSESDVVLYAFAVHDFEEHILKYPHAAQYVAAEGGVAPDYLPGKGRREPHTLFLHDIVRRKPPVLLAADATVADAARTLLDSGAGAVAAVDEQQRARGVLTSDSILAWVARGAESPGQPAARLAAAELPIVAPDITLADAVLALGGADVPALVMTAGGTADGPVQSVVTAIDLGAPFGDQPVLLLRQLHRAASLDELRELNRRVRAFALAHLDGPASIDWLARFTHLADVAAVRRLLTLDGLDAVPGGWCFAGGSGRAESLTSVAPSLLLVLADAADRAAGLDAYRRVRQRLLDAGFLERADASFEESFHVASASEWTARYRGWISDPVRQEAYRARALFDIRPVAGAMALWPPVEAAIMAAVDSAFLQVLANDCLANLPPLTFFQDTVVNSVGEHSTSFQLERSALQPLVDVGRVFGLGARRPLGSTTLERLAGATSMLPEHDFLFREACDTLRVVLWLQGRIGITQGTDGAELPPALLSGYDRRVLKGGFRSILRLLELTDARGWVASL